jgi:hypothetical protein
MIVERSKSQRNKKRDLSLVQEHADDSARSAGGRAKELRNAPAGPDTGRSTKKPKDAKPVAGTEGSDHKPGTIAVKEIHTHPMFVDLLAISEDLKANLVRSMGENGYYESEPIVLATWPGQEDPVLIDGHARREAALEVGITAVPAVLVRSESELSVLQLAINLQTGRRATTDGALYRLCCEFDRLLERGGHEARKEGRDLPPHGAKSLGRSA